MAGRLHIISVSANGEARKHLKTTSSEFFVLNLDQIEFRTLFEELLKHVVCQ